jgi:hypothetical protein
MNTALGSKGIMQRFCIQQVINTSGVIAVSVLYQETIYKMIEDIIQRMLEYYGTKV